MRPQQDIAFRLSDFPDNVPAAATEILHLDVTPEILELLRNIFRSCGRAWRAGMSALTRGICEPGDVSLQTVDGNGGDGKECDEESSQEYRKFPSVHKKR